jgi:hypothetical protein
MSNTTITTDFVQSVLAKTALEFIAKSDSTVVAAFFAIGGLALFGREVVTQVRNIVKAKFDKDIRAKEIDQQAKESEKRAEIILAKIEKGIPLTDSEKS